MKPIPTPPPRFANLPEIDSLPPGSVDRELAIFLHEHPDLRVSLKTEGWRNLSTEAKHLLIAKVRASLGIKPLKTRILPYVGEED